MTSWGQHLTHLSEGVAHLMMLLSSTPMTTSECSMDPYPEKDPSSLGLLDPFDPLAPPREESAGRVDMLGLNLKLIGTRLSEVARPIILLPSAERTKSVICVVLKSHCLMISPCSLCHEYSARAIRVKDEV